MSEDALGNVTPIRARLSDREYDEERAKLRDLYGSTDVEALAKRDQALAAFFARSGWTQEELAKKERKSQTWIVCRLRFGRFLAFITTVINANSVPANLTEGRFREFWEQTKGVNEAARFRDVAHLMQSQSIAAKRRPSIGAKIKEEFADGKWHRLSTIAERVEADEKHACETLEYMSKNKSFNCKAEKKTVGTHLEFRVFKLDKSISSGELVERLGPIVKALEAEGRKNMATMSPATVAIYAGKLRNLLDEWSE